MKKASHEDTKARRPGGARSVKGSVSSVQPDGASAKKVSRGDAGSAESGHGLKLPSVISKSSPLSILLPYQRDWVLDPARFKMGLWARQTGKSFGTAAESVVDCMQRKTTWVTLSTGERQALEWMNKAREWAEAFQFAIAADGVERDAPEALMKAAEIKFANGSRLIAIPANPATARGYSANLTLDEFAFHENPDAIWKAIYPTISNPLRGVFKLRIVTTPNGLGNKAADIWLKPNDYAKHKIDIETAVKMGLPTDIEELRKGLDDPEAWAQEYMCEFLDAASVLLSYELLAKLESAEATVIVPPEFWTVRNQRTFYCGIDFGRKKDLTVCWTLELVGDVLHTVEVLEMKGVSTPDQVEILKPRIARARATALDYTGPGVGLGDYLVKDFGELKAESDLFGKVELCTFTANLKADIFSKLKMKAEALKLRIPVSRVIREDLHSVQRTLKGASVSYHAPHVDGSHADRCTALALAVRAAERGGGAFHWSPVRAGVADETGGRAGNRAGAMRSRGFPC